jgi:fumarylacetoacetate (FAA) hydrolase family protein
MNIVQFVDGGWEVFADGIVITHYLWEAIFEEEIDPDNEIFTREQCDMLVDFSQKNDIDYKEYM